MQKILLILFIFFLQGCTYRLTSNHAGKLPEKLLFEFKEGLELYMVDDSKNTPYYNKYTRIVFPKGEHHLYLGSSTSYDFKSLQEKYNMVKVKSTPFYLTGKYIHQQPFLVFGTFVNDSISVQIDIGGVKTWVTKYDFDARYLKESSLPNLQKLNGNIPDSWERYLENFKYLSDDAHITNWNIKSSPW